MDTDGLTDTEKIAVTVSVVVACLLIAALIAIAIWYFNISSLRWGFFLILIRIITITLFYIVAVRELIHLKVIKISYAL